MTLSRRQFVTATAAGTAAALIGLGKKSARGAGPARARRLLIINAAGGLRSTAAFHASSLVAQNPWGVLGASGALRLGRVLRADEASYNYAAPAWGAGVTVPPIDEAARSFAIVAATDHAPDGTPRSGDHGDDTPRMGTGYFGRGDAPGLLTLINRHLGPAGAGPVSVIGETAFEAAPPAWVVDKPISLVFYGLPDQPPTGGSASVGRPLEDALDGRVLARRRNLARGAVQALVNSKSTLRRFGPLLADRRLRFNSDAFLDQTLQGVSNQMLVEAMGNAPGGDRTLDGDARSFALALRLLQFGAPAVCMSMGGFDTHDTEIQRAPKLYSRYARFVAGVHFALARMPDPMGGMMLDSTLVVLTSEFGRNGTPPTGWNAGGGSDHGGDAGWRNQAHVVFGAGVVAKRLHDTDDNNVAMGRAASTHRMLATMAAAVGVDQGAIDALWPPGSALYPESGPLWELWS